MNDQVSNVIATLIVNANMNNISKQEELEAMARAERAAYIANLCSSAVTSIKATLARFKSSPAITAHHAH